MGMLYARCFVDNDDSGTYTPGDDRLPCVLRFGQDVGLQAPSYTVLTLTTGIGGVSLWGGVYTAEVQWHDGGIPVTASAVYCPAFVFVNPGANVPFDCAFNDYAPAPALTRTPTPLPDYCPTCPDRTPTPTRAAPSATANAATKTRAAGG
jgi:hypothetical protein